MNKHAQQRLMHSVLEASEHVNLTSIRDEGQFWTKHTLDSLALLEMTRLESKRVLDLGTGGGFPGLALAIEETGVSMTLLDARAKKLDSLRGIAEELGLEHVNFIHGRAEDLAHEQAYREQYDVVCARAVASLPTLLELASGFVRPGGHLYAWKGPSVEEEIIESETALKKLNVEIKYIFKYELGDHHLCILDIKKIAHLSSFYPRKAGVPKKKPL